ncbi:hypothetical protein [Flavobacterium sp.]|uniref:hypothetical protein n=1 Tax=Flavobacterium sp. TaxID=239 RepID=UPI0039E6ACD7
MNNSLFYGVTLLLFNYNCAEVNSQDIAANATVQDSVYVGPTHFSDDLVREDSLYTAIIRIDKQSEKEHLLSIQMNVKKNGYFVSPTEPGSFKGKFTIVLTEPQHLQTNGAIIETPFSKVDENEGFVKWVRQNTHYKQSLKVLSNENFEVYGYIQFTIEPRCTLEKIPFILSYVDGKLSVKMDGC